MQDTTKTAGIFSSRMRSILVRAEAAQVELEARIAAQDAAKADLIAGLDDAALADRAAAHGPMAAEYMAYVAAVKAAL
jgi:ABC-type thiamine transport system substrate-binding protein